MSGGGAKLATAYFELIPSMAGAQKSISGLVPSLTVAGSKGGASFAKAFSQSSSGVAASGLKSLQADVARASSAVAQSRLRELDATGRVRVATAQLEQVSAKYGATSVRTIAAQERLATTQRNLGASHAALLANTTKLTTAQGALSKAQEAGAASSGRFRVAVQNVGQSIGGAFQGGMTQAVSVVQGGLGIISGLLAGGALAVTATVGAAFDAGFTRLSTIETAQAKLKALGHTQADVALIMSNANTAVLGTQYSLADAVTASAAAVAAGIKPGQDLTDYLKLQANAAALAGVGFSDLGLVMNQVQSQDKAYTQDLNQVASRGIPIYQSLATVYGTNIAGIRTKLQAGEVDAAHFRAALKLNVGNAADEIGKTTVGSFENMKAAFSRFGAVLVGPVFPLFQRLFNGVIKGLDSFKGILKPITDDYGPKLLTIIEPALSKIGPGFSQFIGDITKAANSPEGKKWFSDMGASLKQIGDALIKAMPSIMKFAEEAGKLIAGLLLLGSKVAPSWIRGAQQIADAGALVARNLQTVTKSVVDGSFWDKVGAKFANGGKQVTDVAGNFWVGLELKFVQGGVQIQSGMNSLWLGIKSLVENNGVQINAGASVFWAQLVGKFANGGAQINAGASAAWAGIVGAFANGGAQINAGAAGAWAGVQGAFANGGAQINAGAHGAWAGVTGAFANGGGQIAGFTNSAVGAVLGALSNGWNQMVGGARGAWGGVLGAFGNGYNQIVGFFAGAGGWLLSAGESIVQGLIDGIQSMIGQAAAAAGQVMAAVSNFLPHSPAKEGPFSGRGWTLYSGQALVEGFAQGVLGSQHVARKAVRSALTVPGMPGLSPTGPAMGGAGGRGAGVYIDKIVAPDQDPRTSGKLIGRELWRVTAGEI